MSKPGDHFFIARGYSYKGIDAQLAGGKTYRVWITARMGFMSAPVGFVPVAPGSELVALFEAEMAEEGVECRELIPEYGPDYEKDMKDEMTEVLKAFKSGENTQAEKMTSKDGT